MDRIKIENKLQKMISNNRYQHSLGVEQTAKELAVRYGANPCKAALAGLVHDCAKGIPSNKAMALAEQYHLPIDDICKKQPELIHGALGAEIAKIEFEIADEEILSAIAYHTTGKENMTVLEKIIYLADLIEPGRDFPGVDRLREVAFQDLNKALLEAMQSVMIYVLNGKFLLHPRTVHAWNHLLSRMNA